jgi:hypothetical protein
LSHQLIKDLSYLCEYYIHKEISRENYEENLVNELQGNVRTMRTDANEDSSNPLRSLNENISIDVSTPSLEKNRHVQQAFTHNYLEDSMSLIEKTAKRLYPVIKEL